MWVISLRRLRRSGLGLMVLLLLLVLLWPWVFPGYRNLRQLSGRPTVLSGLERITVTLGGF